ncbi:MAG TPA: hypothetical protein VM599_05320 [Thermoanaerobaculia bacterium]|nr:hypothetical protein [Thermoanaerobaculia bacterium]
MSYDITVKGRTHPWTVTEYMARFEDLPKLELLGGRLFGSEETLMAYLGLFLEEAGAARAVRLGDPDVWRRAVAEL